MPWPVSKYMTLSPRLPRFSASAASLRLAQQREVDAEGTVRGLGAGDRLEHEVDRRARVDELERGGDVRQHARLRRDREACDESSSRRTSSPITG